MNLLVDTCSPALLLGIADGPDLRHLHHEVLGTGHAEAIMPALASLFEKTGLDLDAQFDKIGVCVGPGSFTGLRVGLAVARARGALQATPLVPLNRLQCIAACKRPSQRPMRVQIDARRGEHFVQRFTPDGDPAGQAFTAANTALTALVKSHPDDDVISENADAQAMASAMAVLTHKNQGLPHGEVVPLYVRAPDAKPQVSPLRIPRP